MSKSASKGKIKIPTANFIQEYPFFAKIDVIHHNNRC